MTTDHFVLRSGLFSINLRSRSASVIIISGYKLCPEIRVSLLFLTFGKTRDMGSVLRSGSASVFLTFGKTLDMGSVLRSGSASVFLTFGKTGT